MPARKLRSARPRAQGAYLAFSFLGAATGFGAGGGAAGNGGGGGAVADGTGSLGVLILGALLEAGGGSVVSSENQTTMATSPSRTRPPVKARSRMTLELDPV